MSMLLGPMNGDKSVSQASIHTEPHWWKSWKYIEPLSFAHKTSVIGGKKVGKNDNELDDGYITTVAAIVRGTSVLIEPPGRSRRASHTRPEDCACFQDVLLNGANWIGKPDYWVILNSNIFSHPRRDPFGGPRAMPAKHGRWIGARQSVVTITTRRIISASH